MSRKAWGPPGFTKTMSADRLQEPFVAKNESGPRVVRSTEVNDERIFSGFLLESNWIRPDCFREGPALSFQFDPLDRKTTLWNEATVNLFGVQVVTLRETQLRALGHLSMSAAGAGNRQLEETDAFTRLSRRQTTCPVAYSARESGRRIVLRIRESQLTSRLMPRRMQA